MKYFTLILTLLLSGCISVDLSSLLDQELTEITLQKPENRSTKERIAVVDVSGVIQMQSSKRSSNNFTPDAMKAVLKEIEDTPDIKAVILRIESPGGNVTATDLIYHDLLAFKEKTNMPVLAVCMGITASGGYYIANAADAVYGLPTSITGSIGVIANFPKLQGLADKVGYQQVVVKSGKLKDLGNPLRDMTQEEQALFQKMVDEMYTTFLQAVDRGRSELDIEDIRPLADGRIYTAKQALAHKLIDGIYYFDEIIEKAKASANIADARIITFSTSRPKNPTIYSAHAPPLLNTPLVDSNIPDLSHALSTGFYYIWSPGL